MQKIIMPTEETKNFLEVFVMFSTDANNSNTVLEE